MGVWQGTQTELTKAVRNLLGHLGTAALWTNYSLKGARGKQALDQTKVYDLIKSRSCFFFKTLLCSFALHTQFKNDKKFCLQGWILSSYGLVNKISCFNGYIFFYSNRSGEEGQFSSSRRYEHTSSHHRGAETHAWEKRRLTISGM